MTNNKYFRRISASTFLLLFATLAVIAQDQYLVTKSVCRLYADFENSSSVQGYIPKGSEVKLIEQSGEYLLVEYEGSTGWIEAARTDLSMSTTMNQPVQDINRDRQELQQQIPVDRFSLLIEKYGYRTGKSIYEHKIWKGMDHNMVRDSWGKPVNITRESNAEGTLEMWTYRKTWLLFRNDILADWGPNR